MVVIDLNEMWWYFENNLRMKDFVVYIVKVCKDRLLCGV